MHIDLPEKRYYKIGEVAKAFDVNTSLIRFWEKEFDVIKPKKNAKGNRLFTQEDIANFKLIFNLVKERGFTLEGAKQKLKKNIEISTNALVIETCRSFVHSGNNGAECLFVGTVRDQTSGQSVVKLQFEAYESMAIKEIFTDLKNSTFSSFVKDSGAT